MGTQLNYSGLVIAGIGFFLTRFTVTLAVDQEPMRFYLAGVVPLVLGLGLAAFGVALVVADVDRAEVRTTATWCVVGAATMFVLVVLTLLGSGSGGVPDLATIRSRAYLSNFLIGGSVGGTLTGVYAARTRHQQRELRRQSNRLEVLNRVLRHEVLNALTAIRGYAELGSAGTRDARAVIVTRADAIAATVEDVKYLARSTAAGDRWASPTDLADCLRESVATVRDAHPAATITVDGLADAPDVRANERLEMVFTNLLENAVEYATDEAAVVEVSVTATPTAVRVAVRDEGPGLPARQRALLETGEIDEFDRPDAGYGLNVVRLLVESYRGSIETAVGETGSTVTVELSRATDGDAGDPPWPAGVRGVRPAVPHLVVTLVAALLAGVAYGLAAEAAGGSVGIIGVLYGARHAVVGWITHEFHSVVFGFVFAGLVSVAPARYRTSVAGHVAIGLAWALVLWVVAAGVVSAVWLRLLGVPVPVPSLSTVSLAGHLAWGLSLGVLTAVGYERCVPWLSARLERTGR